MTTLLIYLWLVACTLVLQLSEISLLRRCCRGSYKGHKMGWTYRNITLIVVFSFLVPIGLMLAFAMHQGRAELEKHQNPWS